MLNAATELHINIGQYQKLIFAFLVGFIGSSAYITALYFKFIGDTDDNRKIVIQPFLRETRDKAGFRIKKISRWKCSWYCFVGGCIAVIFQFDVPNFVSVQSLILGATWPAIVSQFLSGRMANPSQRELDNLLNPSNSRPYVPTNWRERFNRIRQKEVINEEK